MVSARAETKKMTNIGNSASQYQSSAEAGRPERVPMPVFCALTMSVRLSEPTHNMTVMMTKPMDTSYDTICAAERSEPMNGYFEFDAQPPMMMP